MSQIDPRSKDQYIITLSSNRLILAICGFLLVIVLSMMLGIRIERHQQMQASLLHDRAGLPTPELTAEPTASPVLPAEPSAPARPAARESVPAASVTPKAKRIVTAQALPDTIPAPAPILLTQAATPRPISATTKPKATKQTPAEKTTSTSGNYVVQVASSRNSTAASRQAKLLTSQGVPAFVETANLGKQGVWYRVLAGTFDSKTEASATQAKLQHNPQFGASFVRSY